MGPALLLQQPPIGVVLPGLLRVGTSSSTPTPLGPVLQGGKGVGWEGCSPPRGNDQDFHSSSSSSILSSLEGFGKSVQLSSFFFFMIAGLSFGILLKHLLEALLQLSFILINLVLWTWDCSLVHA